MHKRLEQLKEEYKNVAIPERLDEVVHEALQQGSMPKKAFRGLYKGLVGLAAAAALLILSVNVSPAFANNLAELPVLGWIVKVVTIAEYNVQDKQYNAKITVPKVSNLQDQQLETSLNQKYLAENKALFERFSKEVADLKKEGSGGHLGVTSGYEVKTDDERIFSIARYVLETQASSYTTLKYDTIDKKDQVLLTMPILFKNNDYVHTISENIKEQMKDEMKKDPNKIYWIKGAPGTEDLQPGELFQQIDATQNFYINKDHKLVISFDQFAVAPGYMGTIEFIIPTEVIAKDLVGKDYIK